MSDAVSELGIGGIGCVIVALIGLSLAALIFWLL
jgi:hypothetical protein